MNPLISIIVPCYNQAQYLDECLQSVMGQTYENWECIIVNDGSPDDTEQVAKKWLEKDARFKYIYKENGGLSSARNAGLALANGNYIQFLDSDDCIAPDKISNSLKAIKNEIGNNIVISNFKMFEMQCWDTMKAYCELRSELFSFHNILYEWDHTFTIPIHCGFFSASLFDSFRFSENIKAKEDWIMWLCFFKNNDISVVFLDKVLAFYRIHTNSMTKDKNHMFENTIVALRYLPQIVDNIEYNTYLLYLIEKKNRDIECLQNMVVNSNNSIGFKIEKKIRLILKRIFKTIGILKFSKFIFEKAIRRLLSR